MIERIGTIVQGPNDRGFLAGIRKRLGCDAAFIPAQIRGKNRISVSRDARNNWESFKRQGVQLVVRLTDSDAHDWQRVRGEEVSRFPEDMRAILVCGVTEGAVEMWLALDRAYLETALGIPQLENISPQDMIGPIKNALRFHNSAARLDEAVERIVEAAPRSVFAAWLKASASLRAFYTECRDAAFRETDCRVNDELRG